MKIVINGTDYDCVEGSVITRNYNETLDSANIRISHLTNQLNIEPYDVVEIKDFGAGSWFMCVDSYDCIQEGLDPIYYTYEISLFSTVKRLENIILPNIAITPNSENRTIKYYIEQYLNEYASGYSWILSLDTKFNDVCPEMQWNTPTLREVFDDLMMIKDCVCIFSISNPNRITYRDLTYRGTEITDYNYIRRSRSSQDYVSEIRMNLQNAMEDNSSVQTEIIPFTANSGYVMTSNNFVIKTQFPIRKINHLWINFIESFNSTYNRVRVDLINYLDGPLVLEYSAYQLLDVLYFSSLDTITIDNDIYKYQNFCLYYQRYSNVISGSSDVVSNLFTTFTKIQIIRRLILNNITGSIPTDANEFYTSLFFEIEYETNTDLVFSASRLKTTKNKRVIMDNQTNSFVNTKVQADLEYQKANRLGNEQLVINQRAESYDDVIKLAQTYEDNVVYQVQYQLYENHIEVNAIATKNYILKNYFTGIKSHIRTWVNAKDEAVTRHELIKDRYVLSYTQDELNDYSYYLDVALAGGTQNKIKYCTFTPLGVSNARYFIIDCVARVLGTSLVFTFGCNDNAVVYTYYDSDNITTNDIRVIPSPQFKTSFLDDYGGVPLKSYKYVDTNFENTGITFWLGTVDPTLISFDDYETLTTETDTYEVYAIDTTTEGSSIDILQYMKDLYTAPLTSGSPLHKIAKSVNYHKDNKEISKYSYQIEFGVDDIDNLYLSELFTERQECIGYDTISAPTFYKSSVLREYLPDDATLLNGSISVYNNIIAIGFTANAVSEDEYIYVCDNSGNIIIAAKYNSENATTTDSTTYFRLYLNKEV